MNVERILIQHQEIKELIKETLTLIDLNKKDQKDIDVLILKKDYLLGKLKVHTMAEDIFFKENKRLEKFKLVVDKMKDINKLFEDFINQYKYTSYIHEHFSEFLIQYQLILEKILNRIFIEEKEVYEKILQTQENVYSIK